MSLLTTIQRFAQRTNIPVPNAVLGSTDEQVLQASALLNEEGNDLSTRGDWQQLTFEATHTTLAQEDQGDIKTIASNGFSYIKQNTIWDRDLRLPVYVIDGADWQQVKAIAVTGPRYQARFRADRLISNPVPPAGHTWAFEYVSENWILNGSTYKQYFTADDDEILLPEKILLQGLRWRWKKEKGLEYAEDFNTYEEMVQKALSRDGMKRNISMAESRYTPQPRVYVPDEFTNL
jgi:hypothetical protein